MVQAFGDLHSVRKVKYLNHACQSAGRYRYKLVLDVLVAELFNVEEAAFGADVAFPKIFDSVHNCRTNCAGNAVVI